MARHHFHCSDDLRVAGSHTPRARVVAGAPTPLAHGSQLELPALAAKVPGSHSVHRASSSVYSTRRPATHRRTCRDAPLVMQCPLQILQNIRTLPSTPFLLVV